MKNDDEHGPIFVAFLYDVCYLMQFDQCQKKWKIKGTISAEQRHLNLCNKNKLQTCS